MNNYKQLYLKYKKKYKNLQTIQKGGRLLDNDTFDVLKRDNLINNNYYILDYHGSLKEDSYFTIPNNIILILSKCCGALNFVKNSVYTDILNKQLFFDRINNGKIIIDGHTYMVIKPNTSICDFNLNIYNMDFTTGFHKKKFDEDFLYYKIDENQINSFKLYIQTYSNLDKLKQLINVYQKKKGSTPFLINLDKSLLYKKMLYLFNSILPKDTTIIDKLNKYITNLTFLKIINIDLLTNTNIQFSPSIDFTTILYTDIFNILFFDHFIQPKTETQTLEHLLNYISQKNTNTNTNQFVFLYACQTKQGLCNINKCYQKLTSKFPLNIESIKKIINNPLLSNQINFSKGILLDMGKDVSETILYDKFVFEMKLLDLDLDLYFKFDVGRMLICMTYDFIINRKKHIYSKTMVLDNIVTNSYNFVDNLDRYTGNSWNYLIKSILNNKMYTNQFTIIFKSILDILLHENIFNKYTQITETVFRERFHRNIESIHDKIISALNNIHFELPLSLINEDEIMKLFINTIAYPSELVNVNVNNIIDILPYQYITIYVIKNKWNYLPISDIIKTDNNDLIKKKIITEIIIQQNNFENLKKLVHI